MNSTIRLFALFSILILTGLGCSKPVVEDQAASEVEQEQVNEQAQSIYTNEKGYSFEHPEGAEVSEQLNGFDNTHKFVFEDNGYIVSFNEYRGKMDFSGWESVPQAEVSVVFFDDREVYREYERAHAEAFYTTFDPPISISVTKYNGSMLHAEVSAEGDEVFAKILDSMTYLDEPVFRE